MRHRWHETFASPLGYEQPRGYLITPHHARGSEIDLGGMRLFFRTARALVSKSRRSGALFVERGGFAPVIAALAFEQHLLRLVDLLRQKAGPTLVGMKLLDQLAMRGQNLFFAGARRNAQDTQGLVT